MTSARQGGGEEVWEQLLQDRGVDLSLLHLIPDESINAYFARARASVLGSQMVRFPTSREICLYFHGIEACGARPTRARRNAADMQIIRDALYAVLCADQPMTVRQLFYAMVSRGVIEKTEGEYKRTICRLVRDMRLDGDIPFSWIADNTRWMRKPKTHSSLANMLNLTAQTYRRAMWDEQDAYVEIWLEKDALSGVLYDVTAAWDVPLMVTRGYPSLTYVHSAAEQIAEQGKPAYLYYFGDHDPSGVDIPRVTEARLREFAPDAEIFFERVAVTPDQIVDLQLPTRPTKKTDSRAKSFEGESVEVDAIPVATLRLIAEQCIAGHIDHDALSRLENVEEAERETLRQIAQTFGGEAA